jgi:methyltransferase (TIGR00027 family)
MASASGDLSHVSDTALLVAASRAVETGSPDGFIRDPFAARLAGDRGMAMFQALPHAHALRFGIGMRVRFLDELLLEILASHTIATVLSVGCGLDTRPWRLDLPPDLRWVEIDFDHMLDYKESLMSGVTPHCHREHLAVDLNDAAQRQTLFAFAGNAPTLMITEGLLMYLPAATIEAIAADAWSTPAIHHWITDITTTTFVAAVKVDVMRTLRHVQASDCLSGEAILDTIHRQGFVTAARRSYITDMDFARERIERMFGQPRPLAPPPELVSDPTGVIRFARP